MPYQCGDGLRAAQVLLVGYAAMIAADLTYALVPTAYGASSCLCLLRSLYLQFAGAHMTPTHDIRLVSCSVFQTAVAKVHDARAGMLAGSLFVGVHMALTHGVTLGMVASYIPATEIPGIGRITGTCWSFTDFVFGARPAQGLLRPMHPCSWWLPSLSWHFLDQIVTAG